MNAPSFLFCWVILLTGFVVGQESQELKPPPSPAPVSLAPWVLHSRIIHEGLPKYPRDARENHIQGDVTIDVIVDASGSVESAKWINDGTSTLLSNPALEAVRKWRYQPTIVDGTAVPVASWIVIRFQLEDKPNVEILTKSENSTPAKKAEALKGPFKVRVSSGVADGLLIHRVEPEYPGDVRIEGDVVLQITINRHGDVVRATVVSGHPMLLTAAIDAVKQWKYKPFVLNGDPIEMDTTVTVRFRPRQ